MKTKLIVTGLIKNQENKYLISQRFDPKIAEAHLKWDFPGGSVDFGETPEQALRREIIEETGLTVKVLKMIPNCFSKVWDHEDYKIHAIVMCYQCEFIDGNLHLNDRKIHDLKWINKNDFKNYDFLPSINLFISSIEF